VWSRGRSPLLLSDDEVTLALVETAGVSQYLLRTRDAVEDKP
jgi:hypothetical protein